jgi:hypothetical protein
MKNTQWFPMPNDLSADGYVELLAHPDGTAHLGVWTGVLMVASRAKPRGALVREDGRPHDSESLSRVMRQPEPVVAVAIDRLLQIGLLETDAGKSSKKTSLPRNLSAPRRHKPAAEPQEGAVEKKGTEHHHQERNGNEKEGTEGAGDDRKTENSSAGSSAAVFFQRRVDDDEKPGEPYASPEDELKAIYLAKAGQSITIAVLDAIRLNLELNQVTIGDFVSGLKQQHLAGNWKNPAGFLRSLSKNFRAKNQPASDAVTKAEAEEKNYRCPICSSRVRGVGALPGPNGTAVPCQCASQEYTARQRARGIFTEDESC